MRLSSDVADRARLVRMILADVDGVMTDRRLVYQAEWDEAKAYDARDGLGIKLAQKAGLLFGVISGRLSLSTTRRATELKVDELYQRAADKGAIFDDILRRRKLRASAVCMIGDDVVDLPIMRRAGLAAAPADAGAEARRAAHFVTAAAGGRGAVREVIEFILKAQGRWAGVTEKYH